jgi:quercetin dioxygenase-like cupin family protein
MKLLFVDKEFRDDRGIIRDIFYGKNINHGTLITNNPYAVRGNHYHKETTQYTYIVSGELEYYYTDLNKKIISKFKASAGDLLVSEPNEIHAMRSGPAGCVFIAFAEGPRGGEDYEKDTFRVESIIND